MPEEIEAQNNYLQSKSHNLKVSELKLEHWFLIIISVLQFTILLH